MYDVLFHARAQKTYSRLPPKVCRQITRAIDSLRENPNDARNVSPLQGDLDGLFRLRVGEWRVVFSLDRKEHRIFVLAIGPRGDIYKGQ